MKQLVVLILLSLTVAGCGKKPNTLLLPEPQPGQERLYPRPYPKPHQAPPISTSVR
ncbi:MAG TPA: hypothetical protein VGF14_03785 [Alphaproteobacteria bacterium]